MKYTVEQIRKAAHTAAFYANPNTDQWLRMQFVNYDSFACTDENTGEDYEFTFAGMVEAGEDPAFYELTRITIARDLADSNEWIEP